MSTDGAQISIGEIRDRYLRTYREDPELLAEHGRLERQDKADYEGRFVFELLQNAADEMDELDESESPAVRFELTPDRLIVANNGRPLNNGDLDALTRITATTKAGQSTIGHKGRGFISIINITDNPRVYSDALEVDNIEFQAERGRDWLAEQFAEEPPADSYDLETVPTLKLPFERDRPEYVDELLHGERDGTAYTTVFEFPFRDDDHVYERIKERLDSLGENTIALLPALERIGLATEEWERDWQISRDTEPVPTGTKISVTRRDYQDPDTEATEHQFVLFERDGIEETLATTAHSLDEELLDDIGHLNVGVAFRLTCDGRLAPVFADEAVGDTPYIRVFLPTKERSPIPALITGTFQSDTSRRNLTLEYSDVRGYADSFNAYLFGAVTDLIALAATTFVTDTPTTTSDLLACLDASLAGRRDPTFNTGSVEHCIYDQLVETMSTTSCIPAYMPVSGPDDGPTIGEEVELVAPENVSVPYTDSEIPGLGESFLDILDTREFTHPETGVTFTLPAREVSDHQSARVLTELDATQLQPADIPSIFGTVPERKIHLEYHHFDSEERSGDFYVDPVLKLLVQIRGTIPDEVADTFDEACRRAAVFPVEKPMTHRSGDSDTATFVARQATEDRAPFFPSERELDALSTPRMVRLSGAVYRGTLGQKAQSVREQLYTTDFKTKLETIWAVSDPRFEELYAAAIRPYLPGSRTETGDARPFASTEALRAVRELADVTDEYNETSRSPDDPLIYQDARSTYFNLCRLKLPTKTFETENDVAWVPAHRVYFGSEWQQARDCREEQLVEPLFADVGRAVESTEFNPAFLAPPSWFGLDPDDEDFAHEVHNWTAFLRWLGVSDHVRPLPLFSLDHQTSHAYYDTESLSVPARSAISPPAELAEAPGIDSRYTGLPEEDWEEYRSELAAEFDTQVDQDDHRYIYQINPLEYFPELMEAARKDADVSQQVLEHLGAWWDDRLEHHAHAKLANYTNQRRRGSNRSIYFSTGEIEAVGPNLWVWQLKRHTWLTTTTGLETPTDAWVLSDNQAAQMQLQTSAGRYPLLPVVESDMLRTLVFDAHRTHGLCTALGLRTELADGSFTPTDAKTVLGRVHDRLTDDDITISDAVSEVELIYTRVAELLPALPTTNQPDPQWNPHDYGLDALPVLCKRDGEYVFVPAKDAYFVRKHVERQQYTELGIPILNLVKSEAARFGVNLGITDARAVVTTQPTCIGTELTPTTTDHEETLPPFVTDDEACQILLAAILCRLEADRSSTDLITEDARLAGDVYENLTFLDELRIKVTIDDPDAVGFTMDRGHYLDQDATKLYVNAGLIGDVPEVLESTARVISEYLDVDAHYEAILSLCSVASDAAAVETALRDRLDMVGAPATPHDLDTAKDRLLSDHEFESVDTESDYDDGTVEEPHEQAIEGESAADQYPGDSSQDAATQTTTTGTRSRADQVPEPEAISQIDGRSVFEPSTPSSGSADGGPGGSTTYEGKNSSLTNGDTRTPPGNDYREKVDEFGMQAVEISERQRLAEEGINLYTKHVFDVSDPDRYEEARDEHTIINTAIDRFNDQLDADASDPFASPWPGFDILTINEDADGPCIDRCIELKSSGSKTQKPDFTWNEWKAAGGPLTAHYYLYVVRNIKKGNSGDATILEIPRPFETLQAHRTEERERSVQLDLRSFDLDDNAIIQQSIEWE